MTSNESSPAAQTATVRAAAVSPARGVACMLAATFLFAVFNATAKWLSGDYDPFQIVFFRGVFGLLPLLGLLAWERVGPAVLISRRIDLQLLRGGLALASIICFILAYRSMPLADTLAIGYAAPIIVTMLSVPLLAERVGLHRWAAVVVGFGGVLMIVRPGTGVFDPAALFALLGALLYALMMLVTRYLGRVDSTLCTMTHSTILFILACGAVLPLVWVTPDLVDMALFATVGIVSGAGMFFFVRAFHHGEAATIAPFDYSAMLWAIVLGFAIWGDVPGWLTLVGMLVVVVSGLYIMRRESMRARQKAVPSEVVR